MNTHVNILMLTTLYVVAAEKPNIVLFLVDDLGIGDIGAYGNVTLKTPTIDSICKDGVQLTHSLSAASLCSPSRAALLTGRLPVRSGMANVLNNAMSYGGLDRDEWTLPKMLKLEGYSTAIIGKWHQGWNKGIADQFYHPYNYGFDYFFGLPFTLTHDFGFKKSVIKEVLPQYWVPICKVFCVGLVTAIIVGGLGSKKAGLFVVLLSAVGCGYFMLAFNTCGVWNAGLARGRDVIEMPVELDGMTERLVDEGQSFLRREVAARKPVFLMMSWLHVHATLHPSQPFKGNSQHGEYGDAVEETDWAISQIQTTLNDLGISDNTLVIFSSDHGADKHDLDYVGNLVGGWNGVFRGGKGQGGQEGGIRVPTCMAWSGHLGPGKVITEPTSLMDIMVTIADISGGYLPKDRIIDGRSILPLLTGKDSSTPHDFFFHYSGVFLDAVRYKPPNGSAVYKLHYRWPQWDRTTEKHYCNFTKNPMTFQELEHPELYNIEDDPREETALDTTKEPFASIVKTIENKRAEHQESLKDAIPSPPLNFYRDLANPLRNPYLHYVVNQVYKLLL